MNLIDRLDAALGAEGYRMRKSSPRGTTRLVLEVAGADGGIAAAQWFADAAQATEAARLVRARFGADSVSVLADGHLVLQHAGADRKLPVVHRLAARPGSVLVAHRAERRAVVRTTDGHYVKVVRPDRVHELVRPLESLLIDDVRTPQVVEVDERLGCVTTAAMPGRTLHARLLDRSVPDADVVRDAHVTGTALRALHSQSPELTRPPHTGAAELDAARRWLDAAVAFDLLDAGASTPAFDAVASAVLRGEEPMTAVHRDFHDKQVLVDNGGGVGILDLDLACAGEPSVDVGNLVAHLHLRRSQGLVAEARASEATAAFLDGYGEPAVRPERFEAYVASTWLRLAGVYLFRPSRPGLSEDLLDRALTSVAVVH